MNKDHFFLSWQWHTEAPVFEQPQQIGRAHV